LIDKIRAPHVTPSSRPQHNKRYLNSELLMGPACRAIFGFSKSSVFIAFLEVTR